MMIGRLYDSPTLRAIAPFVIGCVVAMTIGWNYFPDLDSKAVFSLQKWLVAAFLLNSSIIFFGTFEWALTEFQQQRGAPSVLRGWVVALGLIAILVCGAEAKSWYGLIALKCSAANCDGAFDEQLHSSELTVLVIFLLFLAIDALGFYGANGPNEAQSVDDHERDFYKRCIWIIDIPVLLIVGIVYLSRNYIFVEPGQITLHGVEVLKESINAMRMDQPPLSIYGNMIGNSFAVGAILGHILLSQLAFTFLKWEYYVRSRAKLNKPPQKTATH